MTPSSLDALAALLAAAISSALEATFGPPADGISTALRRAVVDHTVNGFRPSLIEAARREAGLREALEKIAWLGTDAPAFGGEPSDFYYDQLLTAIGTAARALRATPSDEGIDPIQDDIEAFTEKRLLHDNAGAALPAEGTGP